MVRFVASKVAVLDESTGRVTAVEVDEFVLAHCGLLTRISVSHSHVM